MKKLLIPLFLAVFTLAAFAQDAAKSAEQEKAVTELMGMFFTAPNLLLLLALVGLGAVCKNTQKIADWLIIIIVPVVGCIAGVGLLSFTTRDFPWLVSLLIGSVDGVAAVFGHQVLKQLLQSPAAPTLLKIPLMPIVATLLGIDINQKPQPTLDQKNEPQVPHP